MRKNKTHLWGTTIEESARRSGDWTFPAPIAFAANYLLSDEKYLKEEGIFRVPGFVGRLNEIKKVFDSGETPELKEWEVETAASIILNFLKTANYEADDDLFKGPDSMATQFADANAKDDVNKVKLLLRKHSLCKRETLKILAYLFLKIEEYSDSNKMTIFSLSVSFGPQFARCFPIMVRNYNVVFPKTIVFRVSFTEAVERSKSLIPAPLVVSLKFIANNGYGAGEEGDLFVIEDDPKRIAQYKYEFNSGHDVHYLPGDIHCSSSLIVHFFRDLQSSLCHSIENEKLLASYLQIKEEEDQYNHVVNLISTLPLANSVTLCTVAHHLLLVSIASKNYNVSIQNICDAFGQYSLVLQVIIKHITKPGLSTYSDPKRDLTLL